MWDFSKLYVHVMCVLCVCKINVWTIIIFLYMYRVPVLFLKCNYNLYTRQHAKRVVQSQSVEASFKIKINAFFVNMCTTQSRIISITTKNIVDAN